MHAPKQQPHERPQELSAPNSEEDKPDMFEQIRKKAKERNERKGIVEEIKEGQGQGKAS